MDIVLLFPGQGSQKPGMGKDLADAFPAAKDVFTQIDETLGTPLSRLAFDGPAEELTATHNAQPSLLAHGAAVWAVTRDALSSHVRAAAGHSLGEFTAHHAAGSVSASDAARLVRRRGELMHAAGTAQPGTMAAILGSPSVGIDEICAQASDEAGMVVPANYNSPEQTVISGSIPGVERAMAIAREAGARRALRLPVAGAFHSPLMEPAVNGLRSAVAETVFGSSAVPVYSNVTAGEVIPGGAADLLVRQLTSPVRWVELIRSIVARFPNAMFVEMGPGAVLTGLLSRISPGARGMACGTPADVEKVLNEVGR